MQHPATGGVSQRWIRRGRTNGTWDDFAPYDKEELGSDPYCFRYPIDWDYCLEIAGDSLESEPAYIRIVSEYDGENYVDVRYADLDAFLATSPQTSQFSYEEVLAAYPARFHLLPNHRAEQMQVDLAGILWYITLS